MNAEELFRQRVVKWCKGRLSLAALEKRLPQLKGHGLDRVQVTTGRITTSWMPWRDNPNSASWYWRPVQREIDVTVGLAVDLAPIRWSTESNEALIPLIVIELKTGPFNTDVLDMKSAIYGALVETYPWVHRVFLHENAPDRSSTSYLRNLRHFDSIYNNWDPDARRLLGRQIDHQMEYLLGYWEL
jgi:hypothetical protein